MEKLKNTIWFKGQAEISVLIDELKTQLQNTNQFCLETIRLTPGISKAEIVKAEPDCVAIETNEGTIVRSKIKITEEVDSIAVTFDERATAGKLATIESHHEYQFKADRDSSIVTVIVSNMHTSGILGFLYKTFGARSNGNAILETLKKHLTSPE